MERFLDEFFSSHEQIDSVGDETCVSGVHARDELTELDGEWQLDEARDDMAEPERAFLMMDSSAELMSEEARSKCVRACCRRVVRRAEVEGRARAQISMDVAA